MKTLLKSLI